MNVLLVAGDREREAADAAELARGLPHWGWSARVLIASLGEGSPGVVRIARADPAPHHWQRSRSLHAARAFRELLAADRPDLVHVLAWRGLTHDLAALCDEVDLPCVITLSDPGFGCLVGDRVRRGSGVACTEPLGPSPCLACAELEHGATPWVPIEARFLAVAERRRDALRELQLARRVIVRDESSAAAARVALADALAAVEFAILPEPTDARAHAQVYAAATTRTIDAPRVDAAPRDWWIERMQAVAEDAWDASFARAREDVR